MTTTVDAYLAELEQLLAAADPVLRQELVDGIREELAGVSPDAADARLRELGDPARVAVGLLSETQGAARAAAAPARQEPTQDGDAAWYPIVTLLLLTIGGIVVPVIGWLAGLIMLWAARGWRILHKVAGTALALTGPLLVFLGLFPWSVAETSTVTQISGSGSSSPNPLIPPVVEAPFPVWLVVFVVVFAAWVAGWIWLLIAHRTRR